MSMNQEEVTEQAPEQEIETKMLGAHVDSDLYWAFKKAAASRGELLMVAIEHAARMYIDSVPKKGG